MSDSKGWSRRNVLGAALATAAAGIMPRSARADICNRYHCNPQTDLLRRFRAMEASKAIIVADEDDVAPAVGLYDTTDGWRPLPAGGDLAALAPGAPEPEAVARTLAAALAQVPPDLAPSPGSVSAAPASSAPRSVDGWWRF